MAERPKQQIYRYDIEPVDISDMLSFVESRQEVYGNKPKVILSMYGDDVKGHGDAAVHYKGMKEGRSINLSYLKAYKLYLSWLMK